MRYTAILVPGPEATSIFVPAMPGCFSLGRTRDEALVNVEHAISGWLETELEQGRTPLTETPSLVIDGVTRALEIIEEMRQAGETTVDRGYALELVTVEAPHAIPA